jgi:hypothetical protein
MLTTAAVARMFLAVLVGGAAGRPYDDPATPNASNWPRPAGLPSS